jgi:hypothetical protein
MAEICNDSIEPYGFRLEFPFTCRKASNSTFLRELLISFGSSGYVALLEIESDD